MPCSLPAAPALQGGRHRNRRPPPPPLPPCSWLHLALPSVLPSWMHIAHAPGTRPPLPHLPGTLRCPSHPSASAGWCTAPPCCASCTWRYPRPLTRARRTQSIDTAASAPGCSSGQLRTCSSCSWWHPCHSRTQTAAVQASTPRWRRWPAAPACRHWTGRLAFSALKLESGRKP